MWMMIQSDPTGNRMAAHNGAGQRVASLTELLDEFKCSPVHMNMTRFIYTELLAEIAESDLCQEILRKVYRDDTLVYEKEGDGDLLAKTIRENSNYALS